jgi:hypothetical protein
VAQVVTLQFVTEETWVYTRLICVGSVVDEVTLEQYSLQDLPFPHVRVIPHLLNNISSLVAGL